MNETMKAIDILKVLSLVASIAAVSGAYAQASGMMENPGSMSAPSNAKAVKKADRKLAQEVRKAMGKVHGFDVSNVYVHARDGAVTLSGTVPAVSQISQAEQIAKTVPGVTSVRNKITLVVP